MEGLYELTNALSNGTIPDPFLKIGVRTPPKIPIAIISGMGKAANFKFGHSSLKILEKRGVSRDCPIFSGTPYYLIYGKSYEF